MGVGGSYPGVNVCAHPAQSPMYPTNSATVPVYLACLIASGGRKGSGIPFLVRKGEGLIAPYPSNYSLGLDSAACRASRVTHAVVAPVRVFQAPNGASGKQGK